MKTKLEINGIEKYFPDEIQDLERLLLFIMKKQLPDGELIVEVKVDEEVYSENDDHQAKRLNLNTAQEIEIATQTKEDFARDFLEEASKYVALIEKGMKVSVKLLKDPGQRENGHDMLARSLEALRRFKLHLDCVEDTLKIDNPIPRLGDFWERFVHIGDRMMEFQERRDSLSIADLLEYQLLPLLEKWRECISLMK